MGSSNDGGAISSSTTFSLSRVGSKKECSFRNTKWSLTPSSPGKNAATASASASTSFGSSLPSSRSIISRNKRRSRKHVLASISANARKKAAAALPIPSFKATTASKLGQLERAFFDDSDDDVKIIRHSKRHRSEGGSENGTVYVKEVDRCDKMETMGSDDEDDDLLFAGNSPFQKRGRQSCNGTTAPSTLKGPSQQQRDALSMALPTVSDITLNNDEIKGQQNVASDSAQTATQQPKSSFNTQPQAPNHPFPSSHQRENLPNLLQTEIDHKVMMPIRGSQTNKNTFHSDVHFPLVEANIPHKASAEESASRKLYTAGDINNKKHGSFDPCSQSNPHVPRGQPDQGMGQDPTVTLERPKTKPVRPKKPNFNDSMQVLPDAENTEDTKVAGGPAKSKRRTRKQCCALCKTCPCQKVQNSDVITTVDLNAFSRSGISMEKALIRRIQKLEKSSESLEEQTEMVRRKLKAHRRETWKRTKKGEEPEKEGMESRICSESYFLPDAEVLENQQMEVDPLDQEVVQKAQLRLFQDIPLQQVTLTQMMGISKEEHQPDTADAGIEGPPAYEDHDTVADACQMKDEIAAGKSGNDDDDETEEDVQSEYVRERDCIDEVCRVSRNGKTESKDLLQDISFSLWDSIAPMTQDGDVKPKIEKRLRSTWDDLFISEEDVSEEGLNDLLNLFDEDEDEDEDEENESDAKSGGMDEEASSSILSQGAQEVAERMISNVGAKSEMLDRFYPKWKENIAFALRQDDSEIIQQALENVQESRRRMLKMRQTILDAWGRQDAALEVFETALEASADRLNPKSPKSDHDRELGDCFTLEKAFE